MNEILQQLSGGDLRSEGRAAEVAAQVIDDPGRLPALVEGLTLDDRLLRARTCMCLEVMSRTRPDLLRPLGPDLVCAAERETVAQARWHLAEIFGNVTLTRKYAERAVAAVLTWLDDKSKIVVHCAVLALGVLGAGSPRRAEIAAAVRRVASKSGSTKKAVADALEKLSPSS